MRLKIILLSSEILSSDNLFAGISRLLLLSIECSKRSNRIPVVIRVITKLAKLDFYLRYRNWQLVP